MEPVNDVLAVYKAENHAMVAGPTALNAFFGLASAIIRGNPNKYCPFLSNPRCFYDQPTNRWFVTVLYISANEYPVSGPGFNGAQIYAMSKWALAAGSSSVPVAHFDVSQALVPYDGLSYSVQPATTPPGGEYATINNGREALVP